MTSSKNSPMVSMKKRLSSSNTYSPKQKKTQTTKSVEIQMYDGAFTSMISNLQPAAETKRIDENESKRMLRSIKENPKDEDLKS